MKQEAINKALQNIYINLDIIFKQHKEIISKFRPFTKWKDYKLNTYVLTNMIYYLLHYLHTSIADIDTYKEYEYALGLVNMLNNYTKDIMELIYMKGDKY